MNDDEDNKIIIEVMGGIEPAKTYILDALHAGKHVVTAIEKPGRDFMEESFWMRQKSSVAICCFEAAVAGAIPIIRPLKQCLAANEISEVLRIVNGTTN